MDSFGQDRSVFNKREMSVIHLRAMERLSDYESIINSIGDAAINNPALTKGLGDDFAELFVNRQVMLYNDLDPDHNLSPFYESETYINNLLLWYPDGIEVDLNLESVLAGAVLSHGNDVYSLDFKLRKDINGNYMNQKLNQNTEDLLFRVAFNQDGGDLRNFRIVGIRNLESDVVPDMDRSLEEVNMLDVDEGDSYTINEGIGALINDYQNYLMLLGSAEELEEDKAFYRASFSELFESPQVMVFNDLSPQPERNLINIAEYLEILGNKYPSGINNLNLTTDSVLFHNVIDEGEDQYSSYVNLVKFFSGMYEGGEVYREVFPLIMRVSFTRTGGSYEQFRIRSIDREAEELMAAAMDDYEEPDQRITPVSRGGFSVVVGGGYSQTHIMDQNLLDLTMDNDNHEWSYEPGYGIQAGAEILYSFGDHLAVGLGAYFNQFNSSYSISGRFEDYNLSRDVNGDEFYKVMEPDYDSTITQNLISLPLTLTYTSSKPGKVGFFATAGLMFSYGLGGKYTSSGSWQYYGHYPDNPPVIEYIYIEELGYYINDRIDGTGDLEGGVLNISGKAYLGLSIPIAYFTQIRLGPEIAWGLSDFNKDAGSYYDIFGNELDHRPTSLRYFGVKLDVVIKL